MGWIVVLLRIVEVPGSNLTPETEGRDYLVVFLSSSRKIMENILILALTGSFHIPQIH
jgi:hypothetical protein